MTDNTPTYLRLKPDGPLPELRWQAPYLALVIVELDVTPEWRNTLCDWLAHSACLYMCAWGRDCSAWDDAMDWANIAQFSPGEIPAHQFVMTTWHEDEDLAELFYFARHIAQHPVRELASAVLLHIAEHEREQEFLGAWVAA